MGWTCSYVAGNVMDKMAEKSFQQSGNQNIYIYKGNWFMWETSRREYEDGSITGSICQFIEDPRGKTRIFARRVGGFRIDSVTGKIKGGYGITELA